MAIDIERVRVVPNNYEIAQGESFSSVLVLRDIANVALDLTGCTISAKMKRSPISGAPIAIGAEITTPLSGTVTLTMTTANTTAIGAGRYIYSVILTLPTTLKKIKVLDGIITVKLG